MSETMGKFKRLNTYNSRSFKVSGLEEYGFLNFLFTCFNKISPKS